jgi:hypothetical protein
LVGLSAACAGAAIEENPAAAVSTVIKERMKRALIFLLAKFKSHSTSVFSASIVGCRLLVLGG